jgi:hypothetical protein
MKESVTDLLQLVGATAQTAREVTSAHLPTTRSRKRVFGKKVLAPFSKNGKARAASSMVQASDN